jgi:hypothetical protein
MATIRTRSAHESCQGPRLDVAPNVIKQLLLATLDGYRVVQARPREGLWSHSESRHILIELAGFEVLLPIRQSLVELFRLLVFLLEDYDSSLGVTHLQRLNEEHLQADEADKEGDEDTELLSALWDCWTHVAPDVGALIVECGVSVVGSPHDVRSCGRSGNGAQLIGPDRVRKTSNPSSSDVAGNDEVGITGKLTSAVFGCVTHVDTAKFVHEQRLVCVTQRVKVKEPEQPSLHSEDGNHVTRVSDLFVSHAPSRLLLPHHDRYQDTRQLSHQRILRTHAAVLTLAATSYDLVATPRVRKKEAMTKKPVRICSSVCRCFR